MRPVVLIVLDGWGYREDAEHNAISAAQTPVFDALWTQYPHALLDASGPAVGLPEGQMGNSEIGHMTIGAGRVIDTDLVRIAKAIHNNEFSENPEFLHLFSEVKRRRSTLHVLGLIGYGGVHSHSEHLHAFLSAAHAAGVTRVAIHAITDGRDTPPTSAAEYLRDLETALADLGLGHIATVTGRFYAMDRDNNWSRTKQAEDALFLGVGKTYSSGTPSQAVEGLYTQGAIDEHLPPLVFPQGGEPQTIGEGDGIFFFNFRSDRARQLTKKLVEHAEALSLTIVTMTEYDPKLPVRVAFPPLAVAATLAGEISKANLRQAHIAETEKFPHATYFLNGGREEPHPAEVHVLLESRKDVATHDLAPEMRAKEIADEAILHIVGGYDFIFINFANPDMVGHTAQVPAIISAVETVDRELGRVLAALEQEGGVAVVTADHGNAELTTDPQTGAPHTSHTTNLVPCIISDKTVSMRSRGGLSDLAPTVLRLMGLHKPINMTGESLI